MNVTINASCPVCGKPNRRLNVTYDKKNKIKKKYTRVCLDTN